MRQTPLPTVGDTIWMVRTVRVPAGAVVRAPDWSPEGPIERLGDARIRQTGDEVEVAWPLVGWVAGTHAIEVPGPLLIYGDGREDTLAVQSASIRVVSVLPATEPAKLDPQPAAGYVDRGTTAWTPVMLALLVAALILVPLALWRRRRLPMPALPAPEMPTPSPVARWRAAGEREVLLEQLVAQLSTRASEPAVAAWLGEADEVRFAAAEPAQVEALLERGTWLAGVAA